MRIICCIKQVPDTAQVKIDPQTNTLVRAGVESICNPYDLVATEAAVKLAEKYGGEVIVITMGPPQAESALRDCLALGAKEAILVSDRAFAGADTLATSYTLTQTISHIAEEGPVDLVICGKQAIDGDTAQVGPGIATRLGYNQFTYVSEILNVDTEKQTIRLRREVEGGSEIVEGKMPALLTVELELTVPRYASLPEMIRSIRQEVKFWGAQDVGAVLERLGLKGSPTSVRQIFAPSKRTGGVSFNLSSDGQTVDDFLKVFQEKEGALLAELLGTKDKNAQE